MQQQQWSRVPIDHFQLAFDWVNPVASGQQGGRILGAYLDTVPVHLRQQLLNEMAQLVSGA